MTYRQNIEKIYKKLESISQRGEDSYMEFRQYIDQLVESGQYSVLVDTVVTKFNIKIDKYRTVEDIKKDLFKEIRFQVKSSTLAKLSKLFSQKKVYNQGFHFYDSVTNKYLGEIREVDLDNLSNDYYYYTDPNFRRKTTTSEILYLQTIVGQLSSYREALPKYDTNYSGRVFQFVTQSQVFYENQPYDCIQSYTWTFGNPITPTYSAYWTFSTVPTYSVVDIRSNDNNIIDKYSQAINTLKSLN